MRVVNIRHEKYTHYIGRPSTFGNKFGIGGEWTRAIVIEMFERYARNNTELLLAIEALPPDAVLGCFCHPLPCHGDVIITLWKELNCGQGDTY